METDAHFQSLSISFGIPGEGALLHSSKSLVCEPHSRFPSGAPIERDAHIQNASDKLYSIIYRKSSVPSLVI